MDSYGGDWDDCGGGGGSVSEVTSCTKRKWEWEEDEGKIVISQE